MRSPIIAMKNRRAERGQHAGLLLQRYLCENATGEGGNPEEKRAILQAAMNATHNEEVRSLYRQAFDRWEKSLPELTASNQLQARGRLIVGLGSENVLETGIRLHHIYGQPILPGSALKGLAAHYCDQVWRQSDEKFKKGGTYHALLFGTTDDSGCIAFHDAWYVPDSSQHPLVMDVMTPHHSKWSDIDNPVAPTDFDSPTPVPFLSTTGKFHVAMSWCGPECDKSQAWTQLTMSLLTQALADWGIGGKTNSGYGRLVEKTELSKGNAAHASSTQSTAVRVPAQHTKRNSGTAARVRIVAARDKGFDVQEEGRTQGTLTVGNRPTDVQANIGDEVDVEVHNDDPKKPQYRWPSTKSAKNRTDQGKRKR